MLGFLNCFLQIAFLKRFGVVARFTGKRHTRSTRMLKIPVTSLAAAIRETGAL
jgi:hypothetical protein